MKVASWFPTSIRARLIFLLGVAALMVTLVGGLGLYGTRSGDVAASDMYDRGVRTVGPSARFV